MNTQVDPTELFELAIKNFEAAMKAGVKLQEESTRVLTQFLNADVPEEWQNKIRELLEEGIAAAKKNADETLTMVEKNYTKSMELLKQAMEAAQSESIADAQIKTQMLWENSLTALRENTEAVMRTNAQVVDAWTNFMQKNMENTNA